MLLVIKVKRLEWDGCASENRMINNIFNNKPEGTRRLGRPGLRSEECIGRTSEFWT